MTSRAEYGRTLTANGQVTIPAEVRRLLRLEPHDKVAFRVSDGIVTLEPTMTLGETFGSVRPRRRPENLQELRDLAIEEHVAHVFNEMRFMLDSNPAN